jgi:hypothetical protein
VAVGCFTGTAGVAVGVGVLIGVGSGVGLGVGVLTGVGSGLAIATIGSAVGMSASVTGNGEVARDSCDCAVFSAESNPAVVMPVKTSSKISILR